MHTGNDVDGASIAIDNLAILNGHAVASESYRYNAAGQVIAKLDGLGNTETYTYDGAGRRLSVTDANGNTSRVVYDNSGRQIYSIDATGAFTRTWYNAAGQVAAVRKFDVRFDAAILNDAVTVHQLDFQLEPLGAWSKGYQQEFRVYDAAGQLQFIYDGAAYVTHYEYDGAGRLTSTRRYASQFISGDATLTNRLLAGQAKHADFAAFITANEPAARMEAQVYDAAGRVSYVLQRSNGQWTVAERAYDGVGQTIAETRYGVSIAYTPGQGAGSVIAALQAQFSADPAIAATQSRTTRYLYDAAGQTRFVLDPTFAVSEQRYDGVGQVIETRTYGVRPNNIVIDTAGVTVWTRTQASADIRKVRNTYDAAGRLTARTDALSNSESFTYDGADRMLTRTDRMGAVWTYQYDAAGRRTAEISPQAQIYGITAQGALSVATRSVVTRYAYDALGQVTRKTEDADNAAGKRTTSYAYDKVGRLVKTTLPHPGSLDYYSGEIVYTGPAPTVETTYNALGNAVVQKDANNHYSYKIYDGFGRVVGEVDQEHNVTTYLYNAYGEQVRLLRYAAKLITTATAFTSANWQAGKEITWVQVQSGIDNNNAQNRFIFTDYNQRGEKTEVRLSAVEYRSLDNTTILSSGTPTTRYEYNAYGEVVREKVLQASTDFWAETYRYYDRAGRMTHVVDAEGYMTEMQYNATGEVVKTIEYARAVATRNAPLSTAVNPSYTGFTGGLGLSLAQPPAAPAAGDAATGYNRETQWSYDVLGRKSSETLVRHVRGTNGNMQQQTLVSSYGYDAEDRVTTLTNASGVTATTYNALGQVTSVREPTRQVLTSTADATLQNSSATNLASSGLYELRSPYTTMAYDGLGRLVAARRHANGHDGINPPVIDSARDQVTLSVYDALDRVVMSQNGLGDRAWSHYDNTDKLTHSWSRHRRSDGNNDTVVHRDYTYDKTGRQASAKQRRMTLDGVTLLGTDQFEVATYNAFGEIVSKAYEGIVGTLLYTYDNAGRLVTDNSTGAIRKYAYNLAGQQTRESHWVKLDAATAAVQVATTMTVDGLGRTVNVVLPTHTTDPATTSTVLQSYDRWGNVVRVIDARSYQTDYEYNDQNQLVKETRPLVWVVAENGAGSWQRPVHYRYHDVQGRLIGTRDANGNLRQYSYDTVGQQVSVTDALNNVTRYAYDVFGHQRMSQDALGYITWQEFDRADRVTAIGDFLVNGANRTRHARQSYVLNQHGDRLTVTNALNHTAKYDYDSQNRLIRSETAMGVVQGYAYDVAGRKILETNALTESTGTFTDRDNKLVRLNSLSWEYDAFGRVTDHNYLSGRDCNYEYDALSGMLMRETVSDSVYGMNSPTGIPDGEKQYTYYANGRVRTLQIIQSPGAALYRYEYDAAGNETLQEVVTTDNYGQPVRVLTKTEYDSGGRITRVTQDDLNASMAPIKRLMDVNYSYDANGNRRRVQSENGHGYTSNGLPRTMDQWFTYDAESRAKIVNGEMVNGVIRLKDVDRESYEQAYDANGRVIAEVRSYAHGGSLWLASRVYDLRGNRTYDLGEVQVGSSVDNGIVTRYAYDAADRLVEKRHYFQLNSAPYVLETDEWGNPSATVDPSGMLYSAEITTYDSDGRLVRQDFRERLSDNWWQAPGIEQDPAQFNNLSVLDLNARVDYTLSDGTSAWSDHDNSNNASAYDAAGRVTKYRYTTWTPQSGIGYYTHTYTMEYIGWDQWQEKTVSGVSTNSYFRETTNRIRFDSFGRIFEQSQKTEFSGAKDQIRTYTYDASGMVLSRREGYWDNGFVDHQDDVGNYIKVNRTYRFVATGGERIAELSPVGDARTNFQAQHHVSTEVAGNRLYDVATSVVTVMAGENLQALSKRVYGTSSYWYLIADANGLSDADAALIGGTQLKVPSVNVSKNDAGTFRPYNPAESIGSTAPSLPYLPPVKGGCDVVTMILIVVIAVAVTVVTWGAASGAAAAGAQAAMQASITAAAATGSTVAAGSAVTVGMATATMTAAGTVATSLSFAGAALVGAAAGAAGALASQVAGSLAGVSSFSWRNVAAGAVTGAITGGLSTVGGLGGVSGAIAQGNYAAAAGLALGNAAAGYVGQKIAGLNPSFSWRSIAANAMTSVISAKISDKLGLAQNKPVIGSGKFGDDLANGMIEGVVGLHTRRAFGFNDKVDYGSIFANAFGNAAGSAIGKKLYSSYSEFKSRRAEVDDDLYQARRDQGYGRRDALNLAEDDQFAGDSNWRLFGGRMGPSNRSDAGALATGGVISTVDYDVLPPPSNGGGGASNNIVGRVFPRSTVPQRSNAGMRDRLMGLLTDAMRSKEQMMLEDPSTPVIDVINVNANPLFSGGINDLLRSIHRLSPSSYDQARAIVHQGDIRVHEAQYNLRKNYQIGEGGFRAYGDRLEMGASPERTNAYYQSLKSKSDSQWSGYLSRAYQGTANTTVSSGRWAPYDAGAQQRQDLLTLVNVPVGLAMGFVNDVAGLAQMVTPGYAMYRALTGNHETWQPFQASNVGQQFGMMMSPAVGMVFAPEAILLRSATWAPNTYRGLRMAERSVPVMPLEASSMGLRELASGLPVKTERMRVALNSLRQGDSVAENSGRVADEAAVLRSIAARNATPEARLLHQRTNLRGAVADEYALITRGMSNNQIRNEVGPVLAGVMDTKTGKLYFGLNKGVGELPDNLVSVMADRIPIASEIPYVKTHGAGTHAEIHALNDAFLARPGAQMDDFLLYTINAGQRGSPTRWGLPVPRCPHCEVITDGVQYFPGPLRYGR